VTRLRKEVRGKAAALSAMHSRFNWQQEIMLENFERKEAAGYYDPQTHIRKAQLRQIKKAETPSMLRKKTVTRWLRLSELVDISHRVIMLKQDHLHVAKHHRTTTRAVSGWVNKLRKNPKLFSEMISKQEEKDQLKERVKAFVTRRLDETEFVDSAHDIRKEFFAESGNLLPVHQVRAILSKDMGLQWKKIKKIGPAENTTRNLVLRQEFAKRIIEKLGAKTRWINIDESSLGMDDYRRMKWRAPGSSNSIPTKPWTKTISMLLALDNQGESYFALSQSNTNSVTFGVFMSQLVSKLTETDRRWRQRTIIFMDNAKYHDSTQTLKLLADLDVPVIYTGPHSYDAAPCEKWFALFKQTSINPRKIKTGIT
jgi:hypothetical protein